MSSPQQHILVVGLGCFGASTAFHLLQRGYKVTAIDRSAELPAPDAASTDLNKIVRTSYSDIVYAGLAKEAIEAWKSGEWGDAYHESGVIVLGGGTDNPADSYMDGAYQNDIKLGGRITDLTSHAHVKAQFPQDVPLGLTDLAKGYLNKDGGWANASKGVSLALDKIKALGGTILPDKEVARLVIDGEERVTGAELVSGERITADATIIATGSWTGSLFPEQSYGLDSRLLATGQCIATIQLDNADTERYRECPVVLDFRSGFYVFPPNEHGIVKFAIHGAGFSNPRPFSPSTPNAGGILGTVSIPRTITSHPKDGKAIPKVMVHQLRDGLKKVYPELAERTFEGTRLCWYTDTPDSDWLIDFHPKYGSSLLFATGGSGHAYKFLPVIGSIVADRLQGKLQDAIATKFSFSRFTQDAAGPGDASRSDWGIRILEEYPLALAAADLAP